MSVPELIHLLTVAAYFITAIICALCALQSKRRGIWWALALGMLLLAINKQQDLLGLLTALGRSNAWGGDWYMVRGSIQAEIIAGIVLLLGLFFASVVWFLRPLPRLMWLALTSFIFLTGFAAIRAVSLHGIDAFLYTAVAGIYLNWVFELGGIGLIASAAIVTLWRAGQWRRPTAITIHR